MELVCPAGTPAALRAAVEAGAHAVYCGFNDETNARNFPGLNFNREEMAEGVAHAHARGAKVLVAINTFPRAGDQGLWHRAVADAGAAGADAVILADIGLLAHAAEKHPGLRLHLSVQAAAANPDAINLYAESFGVKRVVLPRVLTVDEIAAINREIDVETEVFVFGGLCVMAEGRCALSSYATGKSPNMNGVCSPASHVAYAEVNGAQEARLGEFLIHRTPKGATAPYPTLCKGCFSSPDAKGNDQVGHIFEDPASLDATHLIPALQKAGVSALKIEGRQRSRAYVAQVVRAFRAAVEAADRGLPMPESLLAKLTEGQASTTGAYAKIWR
ncbi:U32 family peptidase [Rhodobacter sp. Har01]|uniref:ubiquinone anaerobic biosynthesis protein UbiU n=1 Tax=Rhodobacter sp. Har01 TaxID=2883999 RepID=UPI001D08BCA8|nr:peptidase U32 family protein [Rhodobacter sp. Har01]MCB6176710.1 U32 family peptidase [Rhodobacter sp. Har01]